MRCFRYIPTKSHKPSLVRRKILSSLELAHLLFDVIVHFKRVIGRGTNETKFHRFFLCLSPPTILPSMISPFEIPIKSLASLRGRKTFFPLYNSLSLIPSSPTRSTVNKGLAHWNLSRGPKPFGWAREAPVMVSGKFCSKTHQS